MIGDVSLLSGWLPITIQLAAAVAVVVAAAAGWRTCGWLSRRVPSAAALGGVVAVSAAVAFARSGWASEAAPTLVWVWVGASAGVVVLLVIGWPSSGWWGRALARAFHLADSAAGV